jgi:GT2 family glycosyltransferase
VLRSIAVIIPSLNSPTAAEVVDLVWRQALPTDDLSVLVCGLDDRGSLATTRARFISTGRAVCAAAARNVGVRASASDVVVFLDADCFPQADWLKTLLGDVSADGRLVVGGGLRIDEGSFVRTAGNLASFHEFTTALAPRWCPYLPSFSLALPRRAGDEVGWFDESFPGAGGEDLDLTIRLARAGYQLRFDPRAAVTHHPERRTFASIWRHGFHAGQNSIRVRKQFPDAFNMPRWLKTWPMLAALAPALAGAVVCRAAVRNRDVREHPAALPIMLASRLAWAWGAASALRRDGQTEAVGRNS